ncbi:hypothetical protein CXB35_27530 [Pseudomonas syringae]|nr:hypothetical protein CXB35_27530 [Pseudomonas syringae]
MLGRDADASHSNGKISTTQAIYELAWATALEAILPHGTVEHACLIGTSNNMNDEKFLEDDYQAILIRSIPLRLAHFERAFRFRANTQQGQLIPRDAERVRENVVQLHRFLPRPQEIDEPTWKSLSRELVVKIGLSEFVRRYAEQLALTRAHFLMIMTSPSNVEITGKLLDFTSCESILYRQGDDKTKFNRRYRELIGEFQPIINCLDNICHYLGKYAKIQNHLELNAELKKVYRSTYIKAYFHFTVLRLGFSRDQIATLDEANIGSVRNIALAFDIASRDVNSIVYSKVGAIPALAHFFLTFSAEAEIENSVKRSNDCNLVNALANALKCLGLGDSTNAKNYKLKTIALNYYNSLFYSSRFTGDAMLEEIGTVVRNRNKPDGENIEIYLAEKLQLAKAAFASSESASPTVLIHGGITVTADYENLTYSIKSNGVETVVQRLPEVLVAESASLHSETYNGWFIC